MRSHKVIAILHVKPPKEPPLVEDGTLSKQVGGLGLTNVSCARLCHFSYECDVMKRNRDEDERGGGSSSSSSQTRRKLEVVQEVSSLPPVGTHHNGNFHTYFAHKIAKLQELHQRAPEEVESSIFQNCVVHVNGVTTPPLADIRRLVTLHGGEFAAYKVSRLTHIVCDYLTDAQLKQELAKTKLHSMANHRKIHIVQARWITDSITHKEKQSEDDYLPGGLKGRYGTNIRDMFAGAKAPQTPSVPISTTQRQSTDSKLSSSASNDGMVVVKNVSTSAAIDLIDMSSPDTHLPPKKASLDNSAVIILATPPDPLPLPLVDENGDDTWSRLSTSQREFLLQVPEELRAEVLQQLLQADSAHTTNSRSTSSSSNGWSGLKSINSAQISTTSKTNTKNYDEDDVVEILSSGELRYDDDEYNDNDNFMVYEDHDDVVCLDSPSGETLQSGIEGIRQPLLSEADHLENDRELLETLQQTIDYFHSSPPSHDHETIDRRRSWMHNALRHWIDALLNGVTNSNPAVDNDDDADFRYDTESILWHVRRCWYLLGLYAHWLVTQAQLQTLQVLQSLLANHPLVRGTSADQTFHGLSQAMSIGSSDDHTVEESRARQFLPTTSTRKNSDSHRHSYDSVFRLDIYHQREWQLWCRKVQGFLRRQFGAVAIGIEGSE